MHVEQSDCNFLSVTTAWMNTFKRKMNVSFLTLSVTKTIHGSGRLGSHNFPSLVGWVDSGLLSKIEKCLINMHQELVLDEHIIYTPFDY